MGGNSSDIIKARRGKLPPLASEKRGGWPKSRYGKIDVWMYCETLLERKVARLGDNLAMSLKIFVARLVI
jgi:hypothetical protein